MNNSISNLTKHCSLFRCWKLMQGNATFFSSIHIKVYGLYSQCFFDVQNNLIPPTEARNCLELEFSHIFKSVHSGVVSFSLFSFFFKLHCRTLDLLETNQHSNI